MEHIHLVQRFERKQENSLEFFYISIEKKTAFSRLDIFMSWESVSTIYHLIAK